MNFFNKTRFLIGAVILLTAINLAVLGTVGFHFARFSKIQQPPLPNEVQRTHFIAKELNLSLEQKEKFQNIRHQFRIDEQSVKNEILENYRRTMQELSKDSLNSKTLDSLANEIGRLHCKHHQMTVEHFRKVKGIATSPEQQEHFRRMFFRMMDRNQADRPRMMNRNQKDQPRMMRNEQRQINRKTNTNSKK
ncbi:MAG TPA: periplasmic heavy metal sensor [Tenuifilaceae bacterium]|nr:periplasmic heavy metal sensor [Tenuifilaceae bacterium]